MALRVAGDGGGFTGTVTGDLGTIDIAGTAADDT